ncbi:cysteine hydrolase [Weeksellaceae bacterium TAE3-ERU29]|nr:cysteine hydrolase [Weeksellaceae bacterium TAE3-ERU29]
MKKQTTAIILVDMLNDFITGSLKCERAQKIIHPNKLLIEEARKKGVYVIFSNDAHLKGVDKELEFWGDHAIVGTKGAEVIPELTPQKSDFIIPKRRYSGFFQTDLKLLLDELEVEHVIITGLHTHMCVRHTTADAFYWNYSISIPKDATDAFTQEDYEYGLTYLEEVYGAKITTVEDLIKEF